MGETDTISRQAALDAIMGQPPEPHYPSWYAAQIEKLPSAQPATNCSEIPNGSDDTISRRAAIDALWKALYEYEDETEKQFLESEELDVGEWIGHRIFVQNMNDIDRQTILSELIFYIGYQMADTKMDELTRKCERLRLENTLLKDSEKEKNELLERIEEMNDRNRKDRERANIERQQLMKKIRELEDTNAELARAVPEEVQTDDIDSKLRHAFTVLHMSDREAADFAGTNKTRATRYRKDNGIEPIAERETTTVTIGKTRGGQTEWYECDNCGEPVHPEDRYCSRCGRRLKVPSVDMHENLINREK